ncbi:hypothetical protein [Haloarcula sebkhae]|uniref:Uncharacterized protein n=2 Tax=Haloarcula sebkhae TaxID=932660 RepID=A0ACC6VIH1_9EURY|nr:hypothetical protein [Haloarcula sebkhae]GGK74256.1 hypothetical protein GCM10009067_28060 [Haloarcula sebkhae]
MRGPEWRDCIRCHGTGKHIECYDDLCHAQGRCMHGDNTCALCEGLGRITAELAERWRQREPFKGVTAPAPDLRARGKLHVAARDVREHPNKSLREADF